MGKRFALELNSVCVMPEYRKSPDTKQPGGMRDVYETVKHLYENGK
jgi:acetyl esterase/lipase